jgi:hypothetical protein
MGIHTEAEDIIFSVFSTTQWLNESIKTYPGNFINPVDNEYIRVHVLTNSASEIDSVSSISGVVLIDIFTQYGEGTRRSKQIADKLDNLLKNKSLSTNPGMIQFFSSSLSHGMQDEDNPSLWRTLFTIRFNFNK